MTDEVVLSDQRKLILEFARSRLESLQIDTSNLDDHAMITRLALVLEIIECKELDGGLHQAPAEYSDRFMDLGALAGEMMAAEGTRH